MEIYFLSDDNVYMSQQQKIKYAAYIHRPAHELPERLEERQLAQTTQIRESFVPGFALVFEGSRCDNKRDAREEAVHARGKTKRDERSENI
jgi:hypothetical protein